MSFKLSRFMCSKNVDFSVHSTPVSLVCEQLPLPLRKALIVLLIGFSILLFIESPGSWLFDPDEARYAEIPQQMLATGDYLTPRLNGSNYFEKPPLLYWLNAISMKVLGEIPFAARLPTRLATLGIALLLFLSFKRNGSSANLWAALVFVSSLLPFSIGRINLTDGILSFGLTLTFLSIRDVFLAPAKDSSPTRAIFKIWMGAAIAVLAKGLIGIVLPGIVVVVWASLMSQWRLVAKVIFSKGLILFLVLTVPWFVLMELKHPGFINVFLVREHFMRYFTNGANRPGSLGYFIPVVVLGLLPWTFYFFSSLRCLMTTKLRELRKHPQELFLGLWFSTVFFFFSFSHSKLIPYMLPAFPAAAGLIGLHLKDGGTNRKMLAWTMVSWGLISVLGVLFGVRSSFIDRYHLWPHVMTIVIATAVGCGIGLWQSKKTAWQGPLWMVSGWAITYLALISVVPVIARDYSLHDLAQKASRLRADQVVAFKTYPHSFPLVLKKPIPVVDHQDELASDGKISPALFWKSDLFWKRWNSDARVVAILRKDTRHEFSNQTKKAFLLSENRKFALLSNFNPLDSTNNGVSHLSGL